MLNFCHFFSVRFCSYNKKNKFSAFFFLFKKRECKLTLAKLYKNLNMFCKCSSRNEKPLQTKMFSELNKKRLDRLLAVG